MIGNQIQFFLLNSSEKAVGAGLVLVLSVLLLVLHGVLPRSRTDRATATASCAGMSAMSAGSPTRGASPCVLAERHVGVRRLVARPGADRDAVLVQRRPVAQHVAGLLLPLVLGRPDAVGVARRHVAARAAQQPDARRRDDAHRDAARRRLRARSDPLARPGRRRVERADARSRSSPPRSSWAACSTSRHHIFTFVPLGRPAQILGHVTFSISYVVVIVRGRLLTIGREYEEAAQDLGASPTQALRTVLLPLLGPAIFASFMIVFATVDRRLRHQRVPHGRRVERDGAGEAVQHGTDRAHAGPERARDRDADGHDDRNRASRWSRCGCSGAARRARRVQDFATMDLLAPSGLSGDVATERGRHSRASVGTGSRRTASGGRTTLTDVPGRELRPGVGVRDERLDRHVAGEPHDELRRRAEVHEHGRPCPGAWFSTVVPWSTSFTCSGRITILAAPRRSRSPAVTRSVASPSRT